MNITGAFTGAILPILVVATTGYVIGRWLDVDVDSLNTIGLYVLLPCLAFYSLATTSLDGDAVVKISIGVVGYALLMAAIAWALGRAIFDSESAYGSMIMASAFPSAGFVGVPLSEFAFGQPGRTTAVVYLSIQSMVIYTLGVYIASSGTEHDTLGAVRQVFTLPLLYAVALAIGLRLFDLVPAQGTAVMETVGLVGNAAIPLMLLVLGIQLASVEIGSVRVTLPSSIMRLAIGPVIAVGVTIALAFNSPTVAKVFILECSTPAAIAPLALTLEYGSNRSSVSELTTSERLSTTILVTTLLGSVVLSVIITLLHTDLIPV